MRFTRHTVRRIANEAHAHHLFNTGADIGYGTRYISAVNHDVWYGGDGARVMLCYLSGYADERGIELSEAADNIVNTAWLDIAETAHVHWDRGKYHARKEQ